MGNHTATENLRMGGNWISSDGGQEGLRVGSNGNVGVGINPTALFEVGSTSQVLSPLTLSGANASASSEAPSFGAANALDGNVNTSWFSTNSDSNPYWQYDFGTATVVASYGYTRSPSAIFLAPGTAIFSGSNDGSSWTVLSASPANFNSPFTVNIANNTAYRYYRWQAEINGSITQVGIGEFTMSEASSASLNTAFKVESSGSVTINNAYTLPTTDGNANEVLTTDGAGQLSWGTGDNLGNHIATQDVALEGNRINNNGSNTLGLGFNNAGALDVVAQSARPVVMTNPNTGEGSYLEMTNSAGTRALFGADGFGFHNQNDTNVVSLGNFSDGDLKFLADATERLRIHSTGELEVNTAYKLPPSAGAVGQVLTMVTADSAGWADPAVEPLEAEAAFSRAVGIGGTARYYKDRGRVYLHDYVTGTFGGNTYIGNLPAGYRPSSNVYMLVAGASAGSVYRMEVQPNGNVYLLHFIGQSSSLIDLDGASFRLF